MKMDRGNKWNSVVGVDSMCGELVWKGEVSLGLLFPSNPLLHYHEERSIPFSARSEGTLLSDFRFGRRARRMSNVFNAAVYMRVNQRGPAARLLS